MAGAQPSIGGHHPLLQPDGKRHADRIEHRQPEIRIKADRTPRAACPSKSAISRIEPRGAIFLLLRRVPAGSRPHAKAGGGAPEAGPGGRRRRCLIDTGCRPRALGQGGGIQMIHVVGPRHGCNSGTAARTAMDR